MSAISQLSLAPFWPNFKERLLGPSWSDSICSSDICPSNICPGDICPYQEYLNCLQTWFWPKFKGGFLRQSLTHANCPDDICQSNICPGDICPYREYLSCYWPNFDQTFRTRFFASLNFFDRNLFTKIQFGPNFRGLRNIFWTPIFAEQFFLDPKCLRHEHFLDSKLFWT